MKEVIKVEGLRKYFGLMFRLPNTNPIEFNFDEEVDFKIHSFFCPTFRAEWYDKEDNLITTEIIKPFRTNIYPGIKFKKLIEIPLIGKELTNLNLQEEINGMESEEETSS